MIRLWHLPEGGRNGLPTFRFCGVVADDTPQYVTEPGTDLAAESARDHLWMHFTRHSVYEQGGHVPIIVRGDGHHIWDDQGKKPGVVTPEFRHYVPLLKRVVERQGRAA